MMKKLTARDQKRTDRNASKPVRPRRGAFGTFSTTASRSPTRPPTDNPPARETERRSALRGRRTPLASPLPDQRVCKLRNESSAQADSRHSDAESQPALMIK